MTKSENGSLRNDHDPPKPPQEDQLQCNVAYIGNMNGGKKKEILADRIRG